MKPFSVFDSSEAQGNAWLGRRCDIRTDRSAGHTNHQLVVQHRLAVVKFARGGL